MAESAEVLSIEVLRDLRNALLRFGEDAELALQDVDFEIRRTLEWLSNEQRLYWQSEIKRWEKNLSTARTELHRKRLANFGDRRPDTTLEERAVRRAEERLETSHKKLERVKRWVPELQHAIQEYRGQSQALADAVEMQIPRHAARLDRMVEALEQYTALTAPRTPDLPVAAGSGTRVESMSRDLEDSPVPTPEEAAEDPPATVPNSPDDRE